MPPETHQLGCGADTADMATGYGPLGDHDINGANMTVAFAVGTMASILAGGDHHR